MTVGDILERLEGYEKELMVEFIADSQYYDQLVDVLPVDSEMRKDDGHLGIRQRIKKLAILLK